MLASVRLTSARSATLLVLLAAAAISPATGFFSTHLPLARRSRGSHCSAIMAAQHPRPERTLGDGDRALKSAAVALGDGKIKHAGRLVAWARQLYETIQGAQCVPGCLCEHPSSEPVVNLIAARFRGQIQEPGREGPRAAPHRDRAACCKGPDCTSACVRAHDFLAAREPRGNDARRG